MLKIDYDDYKTKFLFNFRYSSFMAFNNNYSYFLLGS